VWALCCLTTTIAIYLGKEGWNLYGCLNFKSSYCIYNWCWISIIALKVEFDLIVEYINYINQAYTILVYNVLSMEGRRNVWSPWYLMLEDKLGKVEWKFCNNVIFYHKDRMLFNLGYWYDGNGQTKIAMCLKAHPRMNALFSQCGGLVPPTLNNMEVSIHISDGWT
jgi:hypothetical protein